MTFKQYSQVAIMIDNIDIFDAQSVQFGNEQNDNEVFNLSEGFAGISQGTEIFRLSTESAVPRAGLIVNLEKIATERTVSTLWVEVGNRTLTTKGYIKNVSYSGSIDSPTSVSFEFYGKPAILK